MCVLACVCLCLLECVCACLRVFVFAYVCLCLLVCVCALLCLPDSYPPPLLHPFRPTKRLIFSGGRRPSSWPNPSCCKTGLRPCLLDPPPPPPHTPCPPASPLFFSDVSPGYLPGSQIPDMSSLTASFVCHLLQTIL